MATFWQWRFPKRRDGSPKTVEIARATWLCGAERILVEEGLDFIRENLSRLRQIDPETFVIGSDAPRDMWAEANQHQLGGSVRLLVVRQADRIEDWSPLEPWLNASRELPDTHLVFVSDADDFPMDEAKDAKRPLKAHAQLIQRRGDVVRCSMPTGENSGTQLMQWVQDKKAMPDDTARYLIERLGGELRDIRDVALKLAALPGAPGAPVIDQLCPVRPADDFVDALCRLDKPAALTALAAVPPDDYGRTIAYLDNRLGRLGILHDQLKRGLSAREIAMNDRAQQMMLAKFRAAAKFYDPARVTRARRALALVDSAQRTGAREATMEALVTMW